MRILLLILGCLFIIAGGLYVTFGLCLVGGIVQIIEGIKATPIISMDIALGILRVICTAIAGWGTFFICVFIGSVFFKGSDLFRSRRRRSKSFSSVNYNL